MDGVCSVEAAYPTDHAASMRTCPGGVCSVEAADHCMAEGVGWGTSPIAQRVQWATTASGDTCDVIDGDG
eukprot:10223964-Karenia_brevis.AAC.1